MHFFKNCKNDPIITCDMSFERFFHGENNTIMIFVKYWKLAFLETKNHFCFVCNFFPFLQFCNVKVNFQYFSYLIKILNPTCQDLSIDILQVKIWRFLRVWPKNVYNSSKKVCFSFLGHFRWKKFNQTLFIESSWNIIFYHNLSFKIHNLLKYSLEFLKPKFLWDTLYIGNTLYYSILMNDILNN